MYSKPNATTTATCTRWIDEDYEEELVSKIQASKAYQKHRKHLPHSRIIAHLYVKDNLISILEIEVGLELIAEMDIELFVGHLKRSATIDLYTIRLFASNLSKIIHDINAKGKHIFEDNDKDLVASLLERVYKNYWESKADGSLDAVKTILQSLTSLVLSEKVSHYGMLLGQIKESIFYDSELRSHLTGDQTAEKVKLTTPGELTIILDYSFDRNKHDVSFIFRTKTQKVKCRKLMDKGLIDFLMVHVIDPLTIGKQHINPGEITQISETFWSRYQHTDRYHINKINNQIRRHVESVDKLQFFCRRGRDIEVNCHISITNQTKKERFSH